MTDADLSEWSDFGVGVAGAAALYPLAAAVVVALAAGLVSSWVLLVEIQR